MAAPVNVDGNGPPAPPAAVVAPRPDMIEAWKNHFTNPMGVVAPQGSTLAERDIAVAQQNAHVAVQKARDRETALTAENDALKAQLAQKVAVQATNVGARAVIDSVVEPKVTITNLSDDVESRS